MAHSYIIIDAFFVLAVALIWLMLAYQSILFFLGHLYYRRTRQAARDIPALADSECPCISVLYLVTTKRRSSPTRFGRCRSWITRRQDRVSHHQRRQHR